MRPLPSLSAFLQQHPGLAVLTGAGISESSGIPTYRDHDRQWLGSTPIQHADFLASENQRRRYWARSAVGWPRIAAAQPNRAHHSLVTLEDMGLVSLVVTQNVDSLHRRAGQKRLIELHGSLDRVVCLDCDATVSRDEIQRRLLAGSPRLAGVIAEPAPDGDAGVAGEFENDVQPPSCYACGGILKPDVVFFGGAVPRSTVESVESGLEAAPALLVIGSSLMVYSGFRFVRRMQDAGKPVAVLNLGDTRAEDDLFCQWRLDAAEALEQAVTSLIG